MSFSFSYYLSEWQRHIALWEESLGNLIANLEDISVWLTNMFTSVASERGFLIVDKQNLIMKMIPSFLLGRALLFSK